MDELTMRLRSAISKVLRPTGAAELIDDPGDLVHNIRPHKRWYPSGMIINIEDLIELRKSFEEWEKTHSECGEPPTKSVGTLNSVSPLAISPNARREP